MCKYSPYTAIRYFKTSYHENKELAQEGKYLFSYNIIRHDLLFFVKFLKFIFLVFAVVIIQSVPRVKVNTSGECSLC
jgi:hypothetical protein